MPAMTAVETGARAGAGVPAEAVGPLVRGVGVLRRLAEAGGTLSPSALERATGLARSTVDRITATLARMGYVRLDGRDVVLAPGVLELGNAYLAALRLPALLGARADALADELDESVSLAVADRDGIRFIHQATRRRALSVSFRIGDLLPAERTAPGALFATEWTERDWARWRTRRAEDPRDTAFPAVPPRPEPAPARDTARTTGTTGTTDTAAAVEAAFADRVGAARRDGWAVDDQLIEPGLVAVSAPVRDPAPAAWPAWRAWSATAAGTRRRSCPPPCCPGCVRRWRRWRPTCAPRPRPSRGPRPPDSRPGPRRPSRNWAGTSWSRWPGA